MTGGVDKGATIRCPRGKGRQERRKRERMGRARRGRQIHEMLRTGDLNLFI